MVVKDNLAILRRFSQTAPVDVFAMLGELGLGPRFEDMPANISGMIRRTAEGRFEVLVNQTQSRTRQRFTAAHELGHFIYHRDLLDGGTADTLAFRAFGTPLPNPRITAAHERQANTFAANLLMPAQLIASLKANGVARPDQLAARLGVSEEAMRIRLGLPARQRSLAFDQAG